MGFIKSVFAYSLSLLLILNLYGQTPQTLEKEIDGIVTTAIKDHAFPGCVVYGARKGKPFFFKAYGHFTYDSLIDVEKNTIYDLASITKVTAATLAIMKLWEEGHLDINAPLGNYVDGYKSDISNLTIKELLAHQSGMPPWIRFYEEIKDGHKYEKRTLSHVKTTEYSRRMGRSLYAYHNLYPVIKKYINDVDVSSEKTYQYSGLFFYMVPELIANITNRSFNGYLQDTFYGPMRANSLVFNAGREFEDYEIAPTEVDTVFRMELIHGTVHDEGAALMHGISGNAGLFSHAEDLAKVWQMLLNDGTYGETRYLRPSTIHYFTGLHFPENENHRGLGFDKPLFEYNPELWNMARSAGPRSYGHTGFTGTMVWADPDEDLLFIFLSNRVHPSRFPNKLKDLRIRPLIHQAMYDFIKSTFD